MHSHQVITDEHHPQCNGITYIYINTVKAFLMCYYYTHFSSYTLEYYCPFRRRGTRLTSNEDNVPVSKRSSVTFIQSQLESILSWIFLAMYSQHEPNVPSFCVIGSTENHSCSM